MKKALIVSLLKGIAGMLIAHGLFCLILDKKFLTPHLAIYAIAGLIVGYIVYRVNRKYKGYKI